MEQLKEKKQSIEVLLDGKEVTEEAYLATFYEVNGIKYEYVNGRLLSTTVSIGKIVEYGMFLIELFRAYLGHYKKSNSRILTEFIFHIYGNYRRPDILLINDDRCDYSKTTDKAHLIIELISDKNKKQDHNDKRLEYQSKDVPYYFILDETRKKSRFYQLSNHGQYESIPEIGGDIIEMSLYQGLRFRLSDLFSGKDTEELSRDPLYEYSFGYLRNVGQAEGRIEGIKVGEEKGIKIGEEKGIMIGKAEGVKIGEAIGKAEGEKNKALKIARNLKSMGLGVEQIMAATGLGSKEIDRL